LPVSEPGKRKEAPLRQIGLIKQVQIQRSGLKVGKKPDRYYDPTPLLPVSRLLLTDRGVIGITDENIHIVDAHHADHAYSRHKKGVYRISLGFTSHYKTMRAKFGERLVDGIAGENILVETEQVQELSDLEQGIAIQHAATGQFVHLKDVMVAAPCLPFSHFAAAKDEPLSNEQIKETLQFLHNGCRGFYVSLDNDEPVEIQAGDAVFALD
jgi:hypothetical protein